MMIKPLRHLGYPLVLVLALGALAVGCKKKTSDSSGTAQGASGNGDLSSAAMAKALHSKTCDAKRANDAMAIPDAGELYDLVRKMGAGASIAKSVKAHLVDLAKGKGVGTAFVLGVALAELTLTASPDALDKALPKAKTLYAKAKQANLLDSASQAQVKSLLKKLETVKKPSDFRSFLSLVRTEFLRQMREHQHRYSAMLVLAGGLLLSYHEISLAANQQPKLQKQIGDLLAFSDPVQLLVHELGTCFAKQTKQNQDLTAVLEALKRLETMLNQHKGAFTSKHFASIASITGEALKRFR